MKGGSKRRVTPLSEISCHLPENAVWKKVVLYSGSAKEKEYAQAWSINGDPLCKLCHSICKYIYSFFFVNIKFIMIYLNLHLNDAMILYSKFSIITLPYSGKLSTTPEFFEDLFCSLCCFQEYRVRTSQKALREVCEWSQPFAKGLFGANFVMYFCFYIYSISKNLFA